MILNLEFGIWVLEFGIWDFTHLPILGELGGLLFQDQNKKNKTEIGHWSLVIGHWSLVIGKEVEVEKGRKGDRRQSERLKLSILNIITALRILHWISGLGFGICDFEF